MEKLAEILKALEQGKISADHAESQILDLFAVYKQSELLFDFYKWMKDNGCLYSENTPKYRMKSDIEEFIKNCNILPASVSLPVDENTLWIEANSLYSKKEHSQDGRNLQIKHFIISSRP
jgi:hypothetical protein